MRRKPSGAIGAAASRGEHDASDHFTPPVRGDRRCARRRPADRAGRAAQSLEKITYLFPAPPVLPAFAPIRLAQGKGYFKEAGFEVDFAVGRGGVDVAKQVGAGNAPIGGIVADGPIMVRGNGVPVKIVCVFGGKGFMQLVVREDSGIEKPADLKGKTITVMSYQDTTFYALLGLMASVGLTQNDVNVQQVGPTGVWQFVAEGKSQGMAGVPDWIPPVQAAGVKVKIIPTETYFPHMAQGIAASDDMIKQKPEMIRKFVQRRDARHEGHDGQSGQGGRRVRVVRAGVEGQGRPGSSTPSTCTPRMSIPGRRCSAR